MFVQQFVRGLRSAVITFLLGGSALAVAQEASEGNGAGVVRRADSFARMRDRIADELNLDAAQRAQFEQIAIDQQDLIHRHRETQSQIRAAEQSGDEALAAQLRAESTERPVGGWRPMETILEKLETHLRPNQLSALDALRSQSGRSDPRMASLADDLELDSFQREQLGELAEGLVARFQAQRDLWAELAPLRAQLDEARMAGDEALTEELEAEIAEVGPQPESVLSGFFDDMYEFLDEDQMDKLDDYRNERRTAQGRGPVERSSSYAVQPGMTPQADPVAPVLDRVEEAVDFGGMLELDDEQRGALQTAIEKAREEGEAGENELSDAELIDRVFADVKADLSADQIKSYGSFREAVLRGETGDAQLNDIRLVFRAVRKVKLDREQRVKLREIHKDGAQEFKKIRRDKVATAKLAEEVKGKVVEMLNAEQTKKFERELERLSRRAAKKERG